MAGFYSNHSQSRFLANSSAAQTQAQATTTTTTTTTTTQSSAANSPKTTPFPRSRVPSSKHFSTSVSTSSSGDEKPQGKDKKEKVGLGVGHVSSGSVYGHSGSNGLTKSVTSVHPLRNTWVFWFRQHRAPGNRITDYEEGIKQIGKFSSVESFWLLWTHLTPPSALLPTTDYLLFHSGIRRPVWEDPLNAGGGKWIIRLKKGVADRLWEEIVMAVVGDQFEDGYGSSADGGASAGEGTGTENGSGEAPELCGCTLSVRQSEDVLSIWNRRGEDGKVTAKIRETIKRVLNLPPMTKMEYKTNNDSIHDKTNIRPIPERTTSERATLS